MQNNQKEIYKDIINYEGIYQVSNLGNVKSLERYNDKMKYIIKSKQKAINDNGNGYKTVNLWKNNKGKTFYIHRLVIESFIGEIPKSMEVNHIDGIKENNCLNNLEIVTRKENIIHAFKNGLNSGNFGEKTANNKSGYSNISIKKDKGKSYFVVCIRTLGKRFERRFKDLYEAIVIHNQYMRSIGKVDCIHRLMS